jgi:hypothetical protein
VLPAKTFLAWMEAKGKLGGQHKFPRVLKKNLIADWQTFLAQHESPAQVRSDEPGKG